MRAPSAVTHPELTSLQVRLTSPVLDLSSNLPSIAAMSTDDHGLCTTEREDSNTFSDR